jgi:hypothetical protein
MYLKGSKWSMNRRRKRPNWFRIIFLCLLVLGGAYVNRFVIPNQPQLGVPTPTATRAPESFVTEAEGYFAQGKLIPAIESYKQAVASSRDNPAVYVALARVQVFAGQYKDAQTSAENAILLNNNNSNAHAVRAWALDFQDNTLEAEASVKRALELDPNNALAHAYYTEILVDSFYGGTGAVGAIEKAIEPIAREVMFWRPQVIMKKPSVNTKRQLPSTPILQTCTSLLDAIIEHSVFTIKRLKNLHAPTHSTPKTPHPIFSYRALMPPSVNMQKPCNMPSPQ